MKKPENYTPNGREALNNSVKSNFLQISFIIILLVWVVSAVWVSVADIFNKFQHPVLTISFISSTIVGTYLKFSHVIKSKKLFSGIKRGCTKCGKNKSKNNV